MNGSGTASDPYAHLPDRTSLYDDGRLVVTFSLAELLRGGRPWADLAWRPPDVPPAVAADVVVAALTGHAFSTVDPELAEELAARGGIELRHAHTMSHALASVPEVAAPAGIAIMQLTPDALRRDADELAVVSVGAYPPDHPDHEHAGPEAAADELRAYAAGEVLGPFLTQSTIAHVDGRLAGACIMVDRAGDPPDAGPWIVDVFRRPDLATSGVGAALIAAALAGCRDAGRPSLGLAVTHANRTARRSYRRLGFVEMTEGWTLALPAAD
jgi:GNAT superfamily N-acetyltransferase